ncbi:hypothetical protein [Snodgrassella communis]|uniref:hypothetical protein n=1 Tax=Snodgrassella communis TaxID=2946699 RepID=UPI001EF61349|nr:hypothetical protein [Snodgrassella communis]
MIDIDLSDQMNIRQNKIFTISLLKAWQYKMKKFLLTILLEFFSILSYAKAPDCHSWPMTMAAMWMKNANIVDMVDIDEPKSKITLLASEKKKKGLYTQIYHFVFYDKKGNTYEVITKNDSSYEECSMSNVSSYLISKTDISN